MRPRLFHDGDGQARGRNGLVIATDIQEGMLERVRRRVEKAGLSERVRLHLARPDGLDVRSDRVDFALAFWMAHEVPDKERLFAEILACLAPGGTLLLVEPRMHVDAGSFAAIAGVAVRSGFVSAGPVSVRLSRAALLRKAPALSLPSLFRVRTVVTPGPRGLHLALKVL